MSVKMVLLLHRCIGQFWASFLNRWPQYFCAWSLLNAGINHRIILSDDFSLSKQDILDGNGGSVLLKNTRSSLFFAMLFWRRPTASFPYVWKLFQGLQNFVKNSSNQNNTSHISIWMENSIGKVDIDIFTTKNRESR